MLKLDSAPLIERARWAAVGALLKLPYFAAATKCGIYSTKLNETPQMVEEILSESTLISIADVNNRDLKMNLLRR